MARQSSANSTPSGESAPFTPTGATPDGRLHRFDSAAPTTARPFNFLPAVDACLLEVRAGVAGDFAVSDAQCLLIYVTERLEDAVQSGSLSGNEAWGLAFALRAAAALYSAAGAEV